MHSTSALDESRERSARRTSARHEESLDVSQHPQPFLQLRGHVRARRRPLRWRIPVAHTGGAGSAAPCARWPSRCTPRPLKHYGEQQFADEAPNIGITLRDRASGRHWRFTGQRCMNARGACRAGQQREPHVTQPGSPYSPTTQVTENIHTPSRFFRHISAHCVAWHCTW